MAAAGYGQPGKHNDHSAAYSKCFTAGSASSNDLTSVMPGARCAASGLFAVATATTAQLTYKDCAGNSVDSGSFTTAVGAHFELPVGITELTTNTGLIVWVYWHPISGR